MKILQKMIDRRAIYSNDSPLLGYVNQCGIIKNNYPR